MLIYAGIDEAGYGPMFGPLCVGCSVFVLENHDAAEGAPNLWRMLSGAVCRSRRDKKSRIAVDDSKNLKCAKGGKIHPLAHLERGVLSFASHIKEWDDFDITDSELFARFGATQQPSDEETRLPIGNEPDYLRIATRRLGSALEKTSIRVELMQCTAIKASVFNDQVDRMGNKACVNMRAVFSLVDLIRRRYPNDHPRIIVDRQGGRIRYRQELATAFPDAMIRIVSETETLSRYQVRHQDAHVFTISFMPQAEQAHLPVALASMTAKYVRELHMLRLNRFFQRHLPDLKPTAGYVQDGRRFLRDIEPVIRKLDLPRSALIRKV